MKCICLKADTLFFLLMFCMFRYSDSKIYTNEYTLINTVTKAVIGAVPFQKVYLLSSNMYTLSTNMYL